MSRVENRKLRLLKEMLRKIFLTIFKLNRVISYLNFSIPMPLKV